MSQPQRCNSCQSPIVWIKLVSDKAMPCNPERVTVITPDGETVSGLVSHFATCPEAKAWRKKTP